MGGKSFDPIPAPDSTGHQWFDLRQGPTTLSLPSLARSGKSYALVSDRRAGRGVTSGQDPRRMRNHKLKEHTIVGFLHTTEGRQRDTYNSYSVTYICDEHINAFDK